MDHIKKMHSLSKKCQAEVERIDYDDTGYEIDFIYDIFVEQIEDEREDNQDIDTAIGAAAYHTIVPAYELDY